MAARPALRALAARLGITSSYVALNGRTHHTSDATRTALLAAMGVDGSNERAASAALGASEREARERLLEPVRVERAPATPPVVSLRAPAGAVSWRLELQHEAGGETVTAGRSGSHRGRIRVPLPANPPPGYHTVRVWMRGADGGERSGEQRLIVVPGSCYTVGEALGERRAFGIIANLYTLRGARDWGVGDLGDLGELASWAGEIGAAFVGTSPLHALRNRGWDISPYRPVSRLFRNVLYLDVEAIPELSHAPEVRERIASAGFRETLARCRAAAHVDYEEVSALKTPVLEALHRVFVERCGGETERGRAYAEYKKRQGTALERYATFLALDAHCARAGRAVPWRQWPAAYRDPRSAAVRAFCAAHAAVIDFHCYLQFELDRQLAEVARRGAGAGLRIGLYQDVAVGTAGDGSDPWAFPELFVDGVTVGAPPDDYSATGQDWAFPPIHPGRLAAQGYDYWIRLLRAAFAHGGALRIDHAMGMLRLFWIPRGRAASAGCYVRYPAQDLLGILALESRRQRAVVIGEDLGTVPRGFSALLARWGILSSRVLYFERDRRGGFRPAARYSRRALVTATTHDHAPLTGFRRGRDLELRRSAGQVATETAVARLRAARAREVGALERRLSADGLIPPGATAEGDAEFTGAVHGFLGRTRAPLVGVYLDDLVGETDPVNLPGVRPDRYAGWSRRLRVPLDRIRTAPGVEVGLRSLSGRALR